MRHHRCRLRVPSKVSSDQGPSRYISHSALGVCELHEWLTCRSLLISGIWPARRRISSGLLSLNSATISRPGVRVRGMMNMFCRVPFIVSLRSSVLDGVRVLLLERYTKIKCPILVSSYGLRHGISHSQTLDGRRL